MGKYSLNQENLLSGGSLNQKSPVSMANWYLQHSIDLKYIPISNIIVAGNISFLKEATSI